MLNFIAMVTNETDIELLWLQEDRHFDSRVAIQGIKSQLFTGVLVKLSHSLCTALEKTFPSTLQWKQVV